MAKKRPAKISPIQRISHGSRIDRISSIEKLNDIDSANRISGIMDLNKEISIIHFTHSAITSVNCRFIARTAFITPKCKS
jgi:hypothetical protein